MKKILFFFLLGLVTRQETSAQVDSSYTVHVDLSALDAVKPVRVRTVAIIFHTMEGYLSTYYNTMRDSALCHFAVSFGGEIHNFIDPTKVANGPGRSSLNGDTSIADITINVEFEGFSEVPPTAGQKSPAIEKFRKDLQREFSVPDSMVIIHPVVACFYPKSLDNPMPGYFLLGRKSDAMYFADPKIRAEIGLGPMMKYDMDVWEGRVIQNVAQAKRMGMHIFTKKEIADRVAYLARVEQRRQDSIEASRVQPIEMCMADCIPIRTAPSIVKRQHFAPQVCIVGQKQFFSLPPFILPRRLKVKP